MQDTYDEWHASKAGREGRPCVACHDHASAGGHDPAFVAGALEVKVRRFGGHVTAIVSARNVGHAVPTGDPFRALVLKLGDRQRRVRVPPDGEVQLDFGESDASVWQLTYSHAEPEVRAQEHSMLVSEGPVGED
jgi:hypothetical protein